MGTRDRPDDETSEPVAMETFSVRTASSDLLGEALVAVAAEPQPSPLAVAYLLERLQNTVEGDSNLLDKSVILYGSAMGDPNVHNHRRCPLFVAGGANGRLGGGLHLKAPDGTPMANVMLTLLHTMGLDDLESFGDSTGELFLNVPRTAEIEAHSRG